MNIIIFGPPGAGKGTQAQNIVNNFNLHQVSTGDLLRIEIKKKTEIGKKIEQIIAQGDLVSDDIVNELLKKVITNHNYRNRIIFDGYPRNINQAESLEIMLNGDNQSINFVLFLSLIVWICSLTSLFSPSPSSTTSFETTLLDVLTFLGFIGSVGSV